MKKTKVDINNIIRFETDLKNGLNDNQVGERNAQGLNNRVRSSNSKSYLKIICSNLFTFFNLLCVLCFIALVTVGANLSDYFFVVIYAANSAISIYQEIRAKITIEKLSIVSAPTATVIRNGAEKEITLAEIVLDDILVLKLGAQIPADSVLLDGKVEVNESLLTGESVPVKKEKGSPLLSGSFVSGGSCLARVEKVGDESYVQKLSIKAKAHKKPNSRLLNAMNAIIKTVGIMIFPIAAVMCFINFKALSASGLATNLIISEAVARSAAVVIGMIPSGMFLLTTVALFVGVRKLGKMKTLVQDMYALEMLARADCVCLDKTGTITDGNMAVKEVISLTNTQLNFGEIISAVEEALNDSNQTATALREHFKEFKGNIFDTATQTIPFSSARKYSAVTFKNKGTYVIGAPSYILNNLGELKKQIEEFTSLGRRVILLAHSQNELKSEDKLPKNLTPLALIVLEDNIRKEAIETIKWFKDNDVAVKVISGDDPLTVSQISKRAGVDHADKYVNLYGLTDAEIINIADKYTVFGRVSPEQKAVLVKALKANGHTVAMTGDGVNDILAMKEADCSITVASGSAATRNIAHLVLLDNNFNSMPRVVAEGRRVINNIQQSSSLYLMKTIFTMTFAIISILRSAPYPYTTGTMLMLEMMIIGLPSFALSLQPNDKRVEGHFIIKVLTNALPGSLILVFNVFVVQLLSDGMSLVSTKEMTETLSVAILTFGGWAYLTVLCRPINLYRGCLIGFVTTVLFVWVFFLLDIKVLGKPFFGLTPLLPFKQNWPYILMILCIILADFPLLKLIKFCMSKLDNKLNAYDFSE